MMKALGLWQICDNKPVRMDRGDIELEKHLESWIEADPSLLQAGLRIVGRQVNVAGGELDFLALDPSDRWVVIEIKRADLRREAVAQAIDYASCIEQLSAGELKTVVERYRKGLSDDLGPELFQQKDREVQIIIVGAGQSEGLVRMSTYLAGYEVPITTATFDVFRDHNGQMILARELESTEKPAHATEQNSGAKIEYILRNAGRNGSREFLESIIARAQTFGIEPRAYSKSLMFTPPKRRSRALFTIRTEPDSDALTMWLGADALAEFFPVQAEDIRRAVGHAEWRKNLSRADANDLLEKVFTLLAQRAAA